MLMVFSTGITADIGCMKIQACFVKDLKLWQNAVHSDLVKIIETIIFGPPHFVLPVRQYLSENCPQNWTGRRVILSGHPDHPICLHFYRVT